jgi:transposase
MKQLEKVLKEVAGIDVAQKELVVSLGRLLESLSIEIFAYKVFVNSDKGIQSMIEWVSSCCENAAQMRYVMEATGVYHERLAYALESMNIDLSVILPNKISNYARSLDIKTVTDKTASQAIAQFGLERKLDNWVRPKDIYRELKQLTRERDQIVEERAMVKNQRHAEKSEAMPNQKSLVRIEDRIKFLNRQEKEIKLDIATLLKSHPELKQRVDNICTIPGVGELTAVTVLAETNGFELIRNKKQLTSYAGFDVKEKQSGTSIKGKPRISKRGNRHLRKSMHLPSLSSVKYNQSHKDLYVRLVSKSGIKMKALIAVQRKMLELIFVIDKNQNPYENDYHQKRVHHTNAEVPLQANL